jgi:hypothetical protein
MKQSIWRIEPTYKTTSQLTHKDNNNNNNNNNKPFCNRSIAEGACRTR